MDLPPQRSLIHSLLRDLEYFALLIPLAAIFVFVVACWVVVVNRRPSTIASWGIFATLPLLVGISSLFFSMLELRHALGYGDGHRIEHFMEFFYLTMLPIGVGACLTVPAYLVLAVGWIVRVKQSEKVV